jgi:hypothetical protein
LFAVITGADRPIALAIWYSTNNDRAQREMLPATIAATKVERWTIIPKAPVDLRWSLDRTDGLAEERNNAIHAPCSLYIGGAQGGGSEMGASFYLGHPRAKKLLGKHLLVEFDWCERYSETLSEFTGKLETTVAFPTTYPWPDRPLLPTR